MIEVFKREYCGESIIDLPEDVGNMLDQDYNSVAAQVPQDEYGLHKGTFVVTVVWQNREIEEGE